MHDAGLDDRVWEHAGDRLGEALQPVDHGNQDIADAAVLQLVHDTQPELGALRLLDPQAQNRLAAVGQYGKRDVDRLVPDEALISDLHPDRVEEDQRIAGLQRPALPFGDLLQNGVGDRRDQVRRDVNAVELLQVAADLAHAHAARIHRDDLVVEVREATLISGDQLRVEGAGPVPRNRQPHLRAAGQNRLLRAAVAAVGVALGPLFHKMFVELGVQNALRQRLRQLLDKPVLAEQLLRVTSRQKLVHNLFLDSHLMILLSISMASRTQFLTVPIFSVLLVSGHTRNAYYALERPQTTGREPSRSGNKAD